MRPNLQPKIYKSPVVAQQLYHMYMYATTRYNFVRLKATHKISPLEELVRGRCPPQQFPEVNRYGFFKNYFSFECSTMQSILNFIQQGSGPLNTGSFVYIILNIPIQMILIAPPQRINFILKKCESPLPSLSCLVSYSLLELCTLL